MMIWTAIFKLMIRIAIVFTWSWTLCIGASSRPWAYPCQRLAIYRLEAEEGDRRAGLSSSASGDPPFLSRVLPCYR